MLINEGLDELGDFVLLAARKFGGSFEGDELNVKARSARCRRNPDDTVAPTQL